MRHLLSMSLFAKMKMRRQRVFEQVNQKKSGEHKKQGVPPGQRQRLRMISKNATASMDPAPSAKKNCKKCPRQSPPPQKYPPTKLPAAATSPNPAAIAVRIAKSWFISPG